MPILKWWALSYQQIPGAAQLVTHISCDVQRGFWELSNAGQESPGAQRWTSTPLQSNPAVDTVLHWSVPAESFEEFYKSVWDGPLGALQESDSSAEPAKPPQLPAPPSAQESSTPSSKVMPSFLFQSAQEELFAPKGKRLKPEGPSTKVHRSGKKELKRKAQAGSVAASKKRKVPPDSSGTEESDPLSEEHSWVPAGKHIPKRKKKKVVPSQSSNEDSSKVPSDTVQSMWAPATEFAAGSKDGSKDEQIRAGPANASALEVCSVQPVTCIQTAQLSHLTHGFTIFSLSAEL